MARFRSKRDDVLLKSRTAGTSNEISLSVLDATKRALDDETTGLGAQKPAGKTPLGFIRLFTVWGRRKKVATPTREREILLAEDLGQEGEASKGKTPKHRAGKHVRVDAEAAPSGAPASTWTPPREEISSRKSQRRRGRLIAGIIGGVAVAALAAVGVWAAVDYFSHQETLRGGLDESLMAVDGADRALMALDGLIAQQAVQGAATTPATANDASAFESNSLSRATSYDALEPQLVEARAQLVSARAEIDGLKQEMGDARDYEVANEALAAIDARLAMIDTGMQVMDTALPLRAAQRSAAACWQSLLAGDAAAREAATLIADTTQDNARASTERSQEALTDFEQSAISCADAAELAPNVDLAPYADYINLRVEAQRAAIAADEAYLDRDKDAANESNDRYNELDAQAAAAAEKLSGDPANLIGTYLVDAIESDVASYGAERQKAGSADALLRTYLERR